VTARTLCLSVNCGSMLQVIINKEIVSHQKKNVCWCVLISYLFLSVIITLFIFHLCCSGLETEIFTGGRT
jgi:hypothetical protein